MRVVMESLCWPYWSRHTSREVVHAFILLHRVSMLIGNHTSQSHNDSIWFQWRQESLILFEAKSETIYFAVIDDSAAVNSPEMWSVVGDDDKLGLALTKSLQGLLVAEAVLAGLHDQGQAGVDRFQSFFLRRDERLRLNFVQVGNYNFMWKLSSRIDLTGRKCYMPQFVAMGIGV